MKITSHFLLLAMLLCIVSCASQNKNLKHKNEYTVLLKLIDKRLQVAPLVAKSKWNTKKPIDDPEREKIILDSIEFHAHRMGIDKAFAHNFFQAQFDAGKIKQRQLHNQWTAENHELFNPVPDLATEVRPVLDSLSPILLKEIQKIKPNSCSSRSLLKLKKSARKIISISFDNKIVETAIQPIEDYCKK